MRSPAIVVALVLIASSNATAQAQGTQESPNQPLMFEIAARGYLAGGRAGSLAGDSAVDRLESYVWADQTLCAMGAGDQAPQNVPWTGWHFTGTATPNLPGEMVIDLHWERVWENGARVQGGASGARTYRLRSGERVEIDRIAPAIVGRCGTVELKLEAAVMARAAYLMSPTGGVPGGVAAGVRGGVGSGRGGRSSGGGRGGAADGVVSGARGVSAAGDPTGSAVAGVQGGRGRGGVASATGGGSGTGAGVSAGGRGGVARGAAAGVTGGAAAGVPTGAIAAGGRGGGRGGAGGGYAVAGAAAGAGTGGVSGGAASARGGRGGPEQGAAGGQKYVLSQVFAKNAYEAEVWLVHKKPDGTEAVQQQTLQFGAVGKQFGFPPVQVAGSAGPITLDISGSLQLTGPGGRGSLALKYSLLSRGYTSARGVSTPNTAVAESTTPLFVVSISRRARRTAPFIDTRGATDVSIEVPKPGDVLSFELPPLQKATEDLLKGHTFSLRVRLTEVK